MPALPDIYKHDVDFTALALQYPSFAKQLKSNRQLDFSDPESVRQLTKALLHRDFDINIDLPEDRLCPPVPNRFNYILFIQRLIDTTSPTFRDSYDPQRKVIGIDIGTGASAIYPLLGCRQRPSWRFLATEIDAKSREYASLNIKMNGLESHIKILSLDQSSRTLIPTQELERFDSVDFLLTNPPFYSSKESMLESAQSKSRPPFSSCTGSEGEMITPGGEVAFVGRLIIESSSPTLRSKIQWFSSMLGKFSSVASVIDELREKKCDNYAVTEFIQGQKTRRWCVAWSWMGLRSPEYLARGIPSLEKKVLPFPAQYEFEVNHYEATGSEGPNVGLNVGDRIDRELQSLQGIVWQYRSSIATGIGRAASGDVWSRKARRKAQQREQHPSRTSQMATLTQLKIPLRHRDHTISSNEADADISSNRFRSESQLGGRQMTGDKDDDEDDSDKDGDSGEDEDGEPELVFKITVLTNSSSVFNTNSSSTTGQGTRCTQNDQSDRPGAAKSTVQVRWLQGHHSVLFESFCGWLKRRVS